jgi:hypothetical protein
MVLELIERNAIDNVIGIKKNKSKIQQKLSSAMQVHLDITLKNQAQKRWIDVDWTLDPSSK